MNLHFGHNRKFSAQPPNMINITRIEFIKNDFAATRVQRPMPERLRGLVTETDFESFSDKVDTLFKENHKLTSVKAAQMRWLFLALILSMVSFLINFASLPPSTGTEILFAVPYVLIGICFLAIIIAFCQAGLIEATLVAEIQLECLKLTNRNAMVTFRLVTIEVNDDDGSGVHMEFSHIDVLISDTA